ncbi:MAG: GNAT family N-acetyltransferase, partial [Bythopirellula sp.]
MKLQAKLPDGSTILLRPPREQDIPTIFEGANSSRNELAPWMPWCHQNFCIDDAESWVKETTAKASDCAFTIWDEHKSAYIGNCGLHQIHNELRSAKLGYWVRTSCTGRGIATAATHAVARYAFHELELVRLEIEIGLANHGSHRVAEKLNATREGVKRNGFIHGDQTLDVVM